MIRESNHTEKSHAFLFSKLEIEDVASLMQALGVAVVSCFITNLPKESTYFLTTMDDGHTQYLNNILHNYNHVFTIQSLKRTPHLSTFFK
jgi:hypothetical protein